MEHERISVSAKLCHDEGHTTGHKAGDERHVAREPVQLGDQNRRLVLACQGEGRRELRTALDSVRALAGLDLNELA